MTAKKKTQEKTSSSKDLNLSKKLKTQLDTISGKIVGVEKAAEKQLKDILKKTQSVRSDQLKKVQTLIKDARKLDSKKILGSAERLKNELESKTETGFEHLAKTLNLGTRKELDALKKKITHLEKKIKVLEGASSHEENSEPETSENN